ncbi:MAG: DUF1800 domain-containing protein [Anaerolineae bacterium]|nr:DUF1800 domain-containing protein [Anaerolineae bacterium]
MARRKYSCPSSAKIRRKPHPPPQHLRPQTTPAQAARFLSQASFGPTTETIDEVTTAGFDAWLSAQRTQPTSLTRTYLDAIRADQLANDKTPDEVPYRRDKDRKQLVLSMNFSTAWMRNVVFGKDLLRQRVAWSLSQILVTSFRNDNLLNRSGIAIARYYDTLAQHALGKFEDLLLGVTLQPTMAHYLSSLGNQKADPAINRYPDENYAREVMQLFTIGLWELQPNGDLKLDAKDSPIPTYDNQDVEEFARVFTGLWFEDNRLPRDDSRGYDAAQLTDKNLVMLEDRHDQDAKTLFHGKAWETKLPINNGGLKDIAAAIRALVNHPNTPPFISKSLIKFLVTSNPSSAYIKRVADVFTNNGVGARGDLFAVVRAILLDADARSATTLTDPKFGRLHEPMVRVARLVRAFNAGKTTPDLQYWASSLNATGDATALGQWPMFSPSVFNFFSPGYRHLGVLAQNGLTSPEFQILNSVTSATLANQLAAYIDTVLHERQLGGTPRFAFDFTREVALANTPDVLLARLDMLMCNNQMSATTRQKISDGLARLADPSERVKFAVWLAAVSPDAAIQH